jgi:hypothetical protein
MRWAVLTICVGCLAKVVFGQPSVWALTGFFAAGAVWYWLTWLRTRELDAPRRR